VICTAVSCSVYDESLLGSGPSGGSGGKTASAGHSGTAGEGNSGAGRSGAAGTPGGSSGANSGDGGMMDAAGAMEAGGEGPEGGTGGTSGAVGTAGNGTGGTAGGGTAGGSTAGSGGSGGTGGSAGAGGAPPAAGCAKLSVPIDDANDRAHFVISLTSPIDLSSATTGIISMRVYVQAGVGGTIFNYVQDSGYRFFGVTTPMRPELNTLSGWQTLTFNVGAQPDSSTPATGIVKTDIRRIGIEINAAPATAWSNPTIVYVDSITVATPALSFTLDMANTVTSTSSGTDVSGQVMWLNNQSADTKATGVTLAWQASCP